MRATGTPLWIVAITVSTAPPRSPKEHTAVEIASDKELCARLLSDLGLPVPKQHHVRDAEAAVDAAQASEGFDEHRAARIDVEHVVFAVTVECGPAVARVARGDE